MARQAILNANASLYLANASHSSSTVIAGLSTGFSLAIWFKTPSVGSVCRILTNAESATAIATMGINTSGVGGTLRGGYYPGGASYLGAKSSSKLNPNQWYHGVYTYDGTNGNIYINGQLDNNSTDSPSSASTGTLRIGDAVSGVKGNALQALVYTRALTAQEVLGLYNGTIPANPAAHYPLSEGAGSIAYDISGNGNNGAITGGAWSKDTPSKTRKQVNNNMVYNGDFEVCPVVNVAQIGNYAWINGTVSGTSSTAEPIFGWFKFSYGGTQSAMIDTSELLNGKPSLKLSTTATNSYVGMAINSLDATYHKWNNIPCLPSTSYTASVWVKTSVASGTATTGVQVNIAQMTGTGINSAGSKLNLVTNLVASTGWTQYTGTFTTSATARFLVPELRIVGNDGTATLIADAWFADIQLYPTTAITRSAATGRLTATGRSAA